jgi:hypothetical protein
MSEGHNYTVADDWNLANDFANFITKFVKALRTASRLRWLQFFSALGQIQTDSEG